MALQKSHTIEQIHSSIESMAQNDQNNLNPGQSYTDLNETQERYNEDVEPNNLTSSAYEAEEIYEKISMEEFQENPGLKNHQIEEKKPEIKNSQEEHKERLSQKIEDGEMQIKNGLFVPSPIEVIQIIDVKEQDEGYNEENMDQPAQKVSEPIVLEQSIVQTFEKSNELVERYESETQQNDNSQSEEQKNPSQIENPEPKTSQLPENINFYIQASLNTPTNMAAEPTEEKLKQIYQELQVAFPGIQVEQILLLLYNYLIREPREALIEEESRAYNPNVKYDGGRRYWRELNNSPRHTLKLELREFDLRKQMIKVYVAKGYGLKVFQDYMKSINPNAPEIQIEKEKFKKHFIEIYKITIKKVQEFLTNVADRQFEPIRREDYQKPLTDVINCKKQYTPQFCQIFYRILQATFDPNYENVPNEEEVIYFYKSIVQKLKKETPKMVMKLHQPEVESDPDVWTKEFEETFLKFYISTRSLAKAKEKLIQEYPECEGFISNQKVTSKIENAIREATRYLVIENANCGNPVPFQPSDMDRRFIMQAAELTDSRLKLLKVYLVRPTDPQVLQNVVNFIHMQLRSKYEAQRVPPEVIAKAQARMLPRQAEKSRIETLLRDQFVKKVS